MIKSPKMEELDALESVLTQRITNKELAKVAVSRVKFTQMLVEQFGISEEKNDPMSVRYLPIRSQYYMSNDSIVY